MEAECKRADKEEPCTHVMEFELNYEENRKSKTILNKKKCSNVSNQNIENGL